MGEGIVRNVDALGRIVIPKEFRKSLNIDEGYPVEISCVDGGIRVKKHNDSCSLCGSKKSLKYIQNILICENCIKEIGNYVD
jgi:transcriptional pleiotropic regulator of transition state genes